MSHKWKETIDKYILVNGKLKLTYDSIVLFKDFEGETTWGYSKSLRKGYYLFTDKFEYEEIKSIKRVKEKCSVNLFISRPIFMLFYKWLFNPQYFNMWRVHHM